jgi:hypothetical protein
MALSVRRFGQLLGAMTAGGMAEKLGIPTRPLSVRDMISRFGLPLQQDLHLVWLDRLTRTVVRPPDAIDVPVGNEGGVSLKWSDPGKDSQRKATAWTISFRTGNGPAKISRIDFPSTGFPLAFDTAYTWSVVPDNEFGVGPSSPSFTFKTASPPPNPNPPPIPVPPPNLIGISKLSLFNCQIERHTVFVWVRDITGRGPWGQIQVIKSQFNSNDQCPFDDNGILADSSAILTKSGEAGGFKCTSGNIYQVSIVDPDRPTCEGRNDPDIGNCVVEDQPSFFKFHSDGNELIVMLENGRLAPFPNP